jgi:hypothetical protein
VEAPVTRLGGSSLRRSGSTTSGGGTGAPLGCLHIGNVASNADHNAKLLVKAGATAT